MNGKKFAAVCGNILIGLAVSALAVLLSAVAFGGNFLYAAIGAAIFLTAAVFLLYNKETPRRRCRSITAAAGYVPMIFLLGRVIYSRVFAAVNPTYVREYGGPNAGDGFGLITLYLPGAFMMILLAILIARKLSEE